MREVTLVKAVAGAVIALAAAGCNNGPAVDVGPVSIVSPASVSLEDSQPASGTREPAVAAAPVPALTAPQLDASVFERAQAKSKEGDLDARFELAMLYLMGNGGAPKDRAAAVELLRSAADAGHARALSNLGSILLDPEAGSRDEALSLYEKAAQMGDVDGMRHAAFVLAYKEDGVSLVEDKARIKRARDYLKSAADQGDLFSEAALGALLADMGEMREAVRALKKPALEGVATAIDRLEMIAAGHPELLDAKAKKDLQEMLARRGRG